VSDDSYTVLNALNMNTCHCFCEPCNTKMGKVKVIPNLVRISNKVEEFDTRLSKLETDMKINSGISIKVKEDMVERIYEVGSKLEKQRKDNATLKQEILDELKNSMNLRERKWIRPS